MFGRAGSTVPNDDSANLITACCYIQHFTTFRKHGFQEAIFGLGPLESVRSEHIDKLDSLYKVLASIKDIKKSNIDQLVVNLIVLSAAIIEIQGEYKTEDGEESLFKLPIPPYDLLLPFKAEESSPAVNQFSAGRLTVINNKIEFTKEISKKKKEEAQSPSKQKKK